MNHTETKVGEQGLLRLLPSVRLCLQFLAGSPDTGAIPPSRLAHASRLFLDGLREQVQAGRTDILSREQVLSELQAFVRSYHRPSLRRVINGTGVIIHTNMGRSPLAPAIAEELARLAAGYANLELDLETGRRGLRYSHVAGILQEITGAEAALVVNNNAAAVLLALDTLARNREVVVSRGQLVEIGGSFRIPDVMAKSGARLVEVGTTNRTHAADYEAAIGPDTALLLKVHTSNYRILGFTSEVPLPDLVALGHKHGIPVLEDLGSGCLVDLSRFGLQPEPSVQEALAAGLDLACFSGDKLLGGPQAGILVGRAALIEQIRRNPLTRALRIDKLTLAALEAVLRLYLDEQSALAEIPTLRMLAEPEASVRKRAQHFLDAAPAALSAACQLELCAMQAQAGGGSLPAQHLPSWGLALRPKSMSAQELELRLRRTPVPVIGRMEHDALYLDMRTIAQEEEPLLAHSLQHALALP